MATKAPTKSKRNSVNSVATSKVIPDQYDKPKPLVLFGIIGLVIAYVIGSRALDTGSYWEYLFMLIFFVVSIRLFIRSIRRISSK
jgi:hypothetical protein